MTDEEMAEEYLKKHSYTGGRIGYFASGYCKKSYLAGLKAGRPQWHKIADGDYPPYEEGNYTISVLTDKGNIAYYSYNYDCWIEEPSSGEIDPPIAWCEIPRFEGRR